MVCLLLLDNLDMAEGNALHCKNVRADKLEKVAQMRLTDTYIIPTYIIPSALGCVTGTLLFLSWRGMYADSTEGMVFMICASACMIFLAFIIFHYQVLLRRVLQMEASYAKTRNNLFSQFTAIKPPEDNPSQNVSQTDIIDIDPLEIVVKKNPEDSNLTNVVQLHSSQNKTASAIDPQNKIIINLQAVIKMNERSVQAYEVLARMETKNGTYKSATEIFESFNKKAEFHYLDKTILEQTVEVLDCLDKSSDLIMHINISRQTLESKTAFNKFYAILNDHVLTCNNLILEISQQQFSSLSAASRNRLFSIAELGFKLSIDNCTDYVSLMTLVEEKLVSVIKTPVTKLFEVNNKTHEHQIIAFMKKCEMDGVPFIVTHVDEGYQLQELIKYNVLYAQGFLFSAPKRPTSKAT